MKIRTWHCPATRMEPEEESFEYYSDLSHKKLEDTDNLWTTRNDELCSYEEAIEDFFNCEVKKVEPQNIKEAVEWLIKEYGTNNTINKETLYVGYNLEGKKAFIDKDNFVDEELEQFGYHKVDADDLDF